MRTLGIDLETYSEADIKNVGAFRYAYDPSFEILLFGYSIDGAPALVADLAGGEPIPQEVLNALYDPEVVKTGWNNAFERVCLHRALGRYLPPEQWEDTMVLAATCGLPLSLDAACRALRMPEDKAKMQEGRTLIQYFCKPYRGVRHFQNDAPERWETFKLYCARDVDSEGDIRQRLIRFRPDETEHKFWCLDARINERGVPICLPLARNAVEFGKRYSEDLLRQARELTGLENPNSTAQIKEWLLQTEGVEVESLNKKVIGEVRSQLSTPEAEQLLNLRAEFAKSSVKKFQKMLDCACPDGTVKGTMQFYGAGRTGRFAGRLLQTQNMTKNYIEDIDGARDLVIEGDYDDFLALYGNVNQTLSELVRTAIAAPEGQRFVVADFSAIEARVTAWVADEEWRLKAFREGKDIYCSSAEAMFHVPVVKHGINGELRQKGKIAELACGYGGGVGALKAFGADKMGLSEQEMQDIVDNWRAASPRICELWRSLENAAKSCLIHKRPARARLSGTLFSLEDGILWMTLPSGRRIAYYGAAYGRVRGKEQPVSYMGTNQKTRQWERIETWGGKLTENLVQATARDCLRETMFRAEEAGFRIVTHVHDEIICLAGVNDTGAAELERIMAEPIPWAPGLPLTGEGFESLYYKKE